MAPIRPLSWVLGLLWLASGCHGTTLEYDKMQGTRWPEEVVGGADLSLPRLWKGASHSLEVDYDDDSLVIGTLMTGDLMFGITDKDCIRAGEAMAMARYHRHTPVGSTGGWWGREYHVQGLVLDAWYCDSSLVKDEDVLGLMPDTTQRSTFVTCFRNEIITHDAANYAHHAAHELGHTFNLNHNDGHDSVMSPTDGLAAHVLSDRSEAHLEHHARSAVYPGLGPYHQQHFLH